MLRLQRILGEMKEKEMATKLTYDDCPRCPYECVENTSGQYHQAGAFCPICRRLRERYMKDKEEMMETKLTYTVEAINRPYGASESIPWGDAVRTEGLTERRRSRPITTSAAGIIPRAATGIPAMSGSSGRMTGRTRSSRQHRENGQLSRRCTIWTISKRHV